MILLVDKLLQNKVVFLFFILLLFFTKRDSKLDKMEDILLVWIED